MTDQPDGRRRARVLQVAYACAPGRGSEPGVGWNRATQAARFSDVWVITEESEFRRTIEDHQAQHGAPEGLHFRFVPKSAFQQRLSRLPGFYYLSYNLWHRRALRAARELHGQHHFDLTHQVSMVGFREPGYLWKLGVPFVWGPIGGTHNYPTRMLLLAGPVGALREGARSALNRLQLRLSLRVRRAARRAAAVLTANTAARLQFERAVGRRSELMLEVGASVPARTFEAQRRVDGCLSLLWSGRFITCKALPLLLEAMAALPSDAPVALRVLGDGRERRRWQRLSRRLGLEDRVEWLGWRPHAEALQEFERADLLVFTSMRETTGTVLLEALAQGVPVLAPDHQGAADLITEDCGLKVPVSGPKQTVAGFRDALIALGRDRALLDSLSAGACRRAAEFSWDRQGLRMRDCYRAVLGDRYLWDARPSAPPSSGR